MQDRALVDRRCPGQGKMPQIQVPPARLCVAKELEDAAHAGEHYAFLLKKCVKVCVCVMPLQCFLRDGCGAAGRRNLRPEEDNYRCIHGGACMSERIFCYSCPCSVLHQDAPFLKDKKLGDTELKFIHQAQSRWLSSD